MPVADPTLEYDVFLSHNSKDKPAVEQLARLLRDEYNVQSWLDKWNLVPGNSWQKEIEEALDSCQAFAVFIGPSGIGSWENPEMEIALDIRVKDRKRRVIPVLLPGAPDNTSLKLPSFLRLLTWVDFRGGLDDKTALYLLYCGIKGLAPGDSGRAVELRFSVEKRIPPTVKYFLPYLANCSNQEYRLQEVVRTDIWQSPIAVIVHGDEYQCLEKFRERLEKVSLPRIMQLSEEEKIQSYAIKWPRGISDLKEFPNRLLSSLSDAVLPRGFGDQETIQQQLAVHPVPVLIHATILSSEWKPFGAALLDQYMQFWQKWPQLAPRQRLLVFLFIKYESKHSKSSLLSKPLNKQIESYLDMLSFSHYPPLRGIVLPRLNGVSRAEAEDWARSDDVRALCDPDLVIREIREWYAKESKDPENQIAPMERVAQALKQLLDTLQLQEGTS